MVKSFGTRSLMKLVVLNHTLQSCYNCVLFVTKNSWFSLYFGLCGRECSCTALSAFYVLSHIFQICVRATILPFECCFQD